MKNARFVKFFLLIVTLIIFPVSLMAFDFGLTANINAGFSNDKDEKIIFDFKANLWPRFTFLIGDNAELFLSAGLSFINGTNENPLFVPELLRTEFSMRFGNAGFKAGRINYSDPLSFIVSGLFDGAHFYMNSNMGRLGAGIWYSGLIYKETTIITMTDNDVSGYNKKLKYDDDFFGAYFAPQRLIAAVEWSHPSLGEFLNLNTAAVCQFDFFDGDGQYHNQYLILKAAMPLSSFLFELGGAVELSQTKTGDSSESNASFAGDLGISWILPTAASSRLAFNFIIAGGRDEDDKKGVTAFTPITTNYFGNIEKYKMSALSLLSLNYTMRINREIGTTITASYFIRNDLGTVSGYPVNAEDPGSGGYFLGPEIFARFIWSPLSDIQFSLGGGAFFPSLGDAGPDENIRWRAELSAVLSLY